MAQPAAFTVIPKVPVLTPALVNTKDFAFQVALGIVTVDGVAALTVNVARATFYPWPAVLSPTEAEGVARDAAAAADAACDEGQAAGRWVPVGPEPKRCDLFVGHIPFNSADKVKPALMHATGCDIKSATPLPNMARPGDPYCSMTISVLEDDVPAFLALNGRCMCTVEGFYVVDDAAALAEAVEHRDREIAAAIVRNAVKPQRKSKGPPKGMLPLKVEPRELKRPAATRPDDDDAVQMRPQQPSAEVPAGASASPSKWSSRRSSQE